MPDRISAFVEAVGAEIRWKKARPLLTEEIRTHLLDQRDACVAQGMAEDEAQAEAVRQMGDPVALGADLDRVHRPRPQWGLLALALVLAAAACCLCPSVYALVQVTMAASLSLTLGAPVLSGGFPLVVGNVNTVVDMLLIGLALSALRDGGLPETAPALCRNRSAAFRRVRWENGELIFSLRPRQG